ncbi:MAG: hypothetical protein SO157_09930 [Bullifex sp.]|nr:hypothetical protein [Bullifex sp.]
MVKIKSVLLKILRLFTMVMTVLFAFTVISCLMEGDTSILPVGIVFVLSSFFLWRYLGKVQKRNIHTSKEKAEIIPSDKSSEEEEEEFSDKDLSMVPEGYNKIPYLKLERMIVKQPGIQMNDDEVCFYSGPAKGYNDKEKVVGYTGGGAGVSFRIMKGVSVHTGSSAKKAIRKNVRDFSDGTLYLTNQRILLLSPKYGFSVRIPNLAQVSYSDSSLCFFTQNGKAYSVMPGDYLKVMEIMQLMSCLKNK